MDKEFFECDEYKKSEEFQRFPAEDFRVREMAKSAVETLDVPETSTTQSQSAQTDDTKMALNDAEEFMHSASASASASTSASASVPVSISASASVASVGATGVLASIAAVCVAVTVGVVPITGLTQDTVDEPPNEPPIYETEEPIEEPIDVGTLNFLNYRVEYYTSEDSDAVNSDITFYFEGALSDGLTCEFSDVMTGNSVALDSNTVTFEGIEKGDREFRLTIYNGDEVVETRTVNVEDNYIYDPGLGADYAYKVTYNDDNTRNLYAYLMPGREGDFVTYIDIYDTSGAALDSYETVTDGALGGILNIAEEKYFATFVSYYVKDNNYYSYCTSDEIIIGSASLDWAASASDELLTLTFGSEVVGDIEVIVTHDDLTREEFTFSAQDLIDNSYQLTLGKISHNPTVEIYASAVLFDFDPSGYITSFNGEEFKQVYDSVTVDAFVSSTVDLARCEIFNTSYNAEYGDIIHAPVYLYFDGFLNEGDTYSVKVLSSDGGEVASVADLTLSDKPVVFTDLSVDMEYTFTFYLTANGEETLAGQVTKTLTVYEYSGLPSWFCQSPNPGDVMITYNDDGTSNVYLYMNVQETEYDLYYKVYLVDASDSSVFFECVGKDNVAVLSNIPAGRYALKYGVLMNEGDTCYSAYDLVWPSGTIVAGLNEDGYYPESCGIATYDSGTGELDINVSGNVIGGLNVTIINDDGQSIEITVPVEDVYADYGGSTCTVDLSAYGLTSFTVVIEGEASFQYSTDEEIIRNEVTVTGEQSCPFRIDSLSIIES